MWFQHFHKAAGSTIVSLARKNGETLFPSHLNGHPTDIDGKYLKLHLYSDSQVLAFVDRCESVGCTFVAPEWGVANLHLLKTDPRVQIVTCFREPYERFVSNFIYDYRMGWTNQKYIRDYVGSKRSFSYFNYYTHMLARLTFAEKSVALDDFDNAVGMLACFNKIGIVGHPHWLNRFCTSIGWQPISSDMRVNRTSSATQGFAQKLIRLKLKSAVRMLRSARLVIDSDFPREFKQANQYDYAIFAAASKIANQTMSVSDHLS